MESVNAITQEVSLHKATWRDLRAIMDLERRCFLKDAWPWMDVLAALTFPRTVRIKAEIDDIVAGFVIGDQRRKIGWIASIGVLPNVRRQGIGALLLAACERELRTPIIRLILRPSNHSARSLYLKSGYVEVEIKRRYYAGGEDGLIMERVIG